MKTIAMTTRQPSDHAARVAAVDPERSFIVQAPAGSGKTELLSDRILALLGRVRRPEEILAITFTRKAAAEMHARVLDKLAAAHGPCPQSPHERRSWELAQAAARRDKEMGWNLLQYPARLGLRTIDAFCSQLVRSLPWLSGMGGVPQIAATPQLHYEAAALATLSQVGEDEAVAALLKHLDLDQQRAMQLMVDMLAARDQWMPYLGDGADFDRLSKNLEAALIGELERLSAMMPVGWAQQLAPLLRQAHAELDPGEVADRLAPLADWDGRPFDCTVESLVRWQALAAAVLKQGGGLRKTVDKRSGFVAHSSVKADMVDWLKTWQGDEPWIDALARVVSAPVQTYSTAQREVLLTLLRVLVVLAAQLQLVFRDHGEIDFIEVAQRARQALGAPDLPSDLLLRLDNALSHILLDEFQDTSQAQIGLLEILTTGWSPGDGRTLFLVGDPMQSIYRFRKAEVGLFLSARRHGVGHLHLESLELTNNFRSDASLVADINRIFSTVFPSVDHAGLGAIRYSPSVAYWEERQIGKVHFHPVWRRREGSARARMDTHITRQVVTLAAEALERHRDSHNPVAILVGARSHLGDVVQRLQTEGLPCRAVELDRLDQRMPVVDLVQLARALAHPGDRLAWLSVLRSPLCGVRLSALHALFGADHGCPVPQLLRKWRADGALPADAMTASEASVLAQAANVLLDDGAHSGGVPFAARLERRWRALGGPGLCRDEADWADVEQVFALVERLAPWGGLNPAELEFHLADLRAAAVDGGPAIEVMTIHKAKGLEFESVILMGLELSRRGDTQPLIRFEQSEERLLLGPVKRSIEEGNDPISTYLSRRESERTAYENERLLYVAMTRARRDLHIVAGVLVDENGAARAPGAGTLLGRIWDQLVLPETPAWEEIPPVAPVTGQRLTPQLLCRPVGPMPEPVAHDVPETAPLPTAMAWSGDDAGAMDRVLGTVAHAWLERMGRDGLQAWSLERLDTLRPVLARQLGRAGISAAGLEGAVGVLHHTLSATLSSERGRWLLGMGPAAFREWSLLGLDGRVSIIDLAVSRAQDWLIVDYKTGCPAADEDPQRFERRMRTLHADQLERYRRHVSALDGRPAQVALYFPRADLWIEL